jgi:hypothetical protein
MNKQDYTNLMALGATGATMTADVFAELQAFAKSRKLKQPAAAWLMAVPAKAPKAPKAPKEPKVKAPKAKCDPSLHGSDEECDKDSRSNGVCATHYSRLVYRAQADKAEKAREASRNYAAKIRKIKADAKAAEAELEDAEANLEEAS